MKNALPLSTSPRSVPAASPLRGAIQPAPRTPRLPPLPSLEDFVSGSTLLTARLFIACDRLRMAAQAGQRIRTYEIALEVNLSEFHFARQFRLHFGRSPHQYYDEVRAAHAQQLLARGMRACEVARRVGLQRPAALRSLLRKHSG